MNTVEAERHRAQHTNTRERPMLRRVPKPSARKNLDVDSTSEATPFEELASSVPNTSG